MWLLKELIYLTALHPPVMHDMDRCIVAKLWKSRIGCVSLLMKTKAKFLSKKVSMQKITIPLWKIVYAIHVNSILVLIYIFFLSIKLSFIIILPAFIISM